LPQSTYCERSRLIATVRANPSGPSIRPRWTVAMPPDAILRRARTGRAPAASRSQNPPIRPEYIKWRAQSNDLSTLSIVGPRTSRRTTLALALCAFCASSTVGALSCSTVYQARPHNASTRWNMPGAVVTTTGCNVTLDGFDYTLHNSVVTREL
jgi:hypothetical protein